MRDPRFLEYSPPRAARLRDELDALRSLLWEIYTYREEGPYGELYAGEQLQFDLRHLVLAQADLKRQLKRLLRVYAAILLFISSYEEVAEWKENVERAAADRGRIDPEDPDADPTGVEIITAIHTLNDWGEHLASECTWPAFLLHYIRQNVVPLLCALATGVVASLLAQLLIVSVR